MKVSRTWLQKYFAEPLPSMEVIADKLTFGAFEIEEVMGEMLDVNVLPDRASYALCHRGIALEIGALLDKKVENDPLKRPLPEKVQGSTLKLSVDIEDPTKCTRYMATLVQGVQVKNSPQWLAQALESVGQRSINNIVDATNYVMLNIGQPLHAYDAGKVVDGAITVRSAKESEKVDLLGIDECIVPKGTLLITETQTQTPLGVAGIKGGKQALLDEHTTDIIVESANFEGSGIRKTSQALKLWTDASLRFQNKLSPELCSYGMSEVVALIQEIAGGTVVASIDEYPVNAPQLQSVSVSLSKVQEVLGRVCTLDEISAVFKRLGFSYTLTNEVYTVMPEFVRRDITIPEDLIEEIGRVLGYDTIASVQLPELARTPDQNLYKGIECIKDFLTDRGFTEVSTQTFALQGDIVLENPLQSDRPALRTNLLDTMSDALARGGAHAPRYLGTAPLLKLFEIGTIFPKEGETTALSIGYKALSGKSSTSLLEELQQDLLETFSALNGVLSTKDDCIQIPLASSVLTEIGEGYAPKKLTSGPYQPYSMYPCALRDIAVWTLQDTEESEVALVIEREAGELLARIDLFDRFEKDGRISYAFRLVLESFERTLTDADIDPLMETITEALNAKEGWQVR
jgi:phenylalanyl-tRNA synthetase beta chain